MAYKICFATGNEHKVKELNEITEIFAGKDYIKFSAPPKPFDPIENADTFDGNALIKAQEANKTTGMITLADDSGLCVDALNGRPGLYSARYAPTQDEKIEKLLGEMKDTVNRKAKFVCAMTLLDENGEILLQTRGECHGEIALKRAGTNGFGFDPIFIPSGENRTLAEMSEEEKNKISHRSNALQKVINYLKTTK